MSQLWCREWLRWGCSDRVVPTLTHLELSHHIVVFVNDVVAVHHVFTLVGAILGNDAYRLAFADVEDILPTPFIGKRWSTVAIEELQIN